MVKPWMGLNKQACDYSCVKLTVASLKGDSCLYQLWVYKAPYLRLRSANSGKIDFLIMVAAEILSKGQRAEIVLVVEDATISTPI